MDKWLECKVEVYGKWMCEGKIKLLTPQICFCFAWTELRAANSKVLGSFEPLFLPAAAHVRRS